MTSLPSAEALSAASSAFAADVRHGLGASRKSLPCKYFYDEVGAKLFDEITTLPEYYPTRTELSILRTHAGSIAKVMGPRARLVELGSGEGEKTPLLLDALEAPAAYVPVDISEGQLIEVAARFRARYPRLLVTPVAADYTAPFALPEPPPLARRTLAYFAGSTIGNFEPRAAVGFLASLRAWLGQDGAALIGVDLDKDPRVLEAAYNDAAGVTAAFNLNLLVRVNRELGGDFDVSAFEHRAVYEAGPGRMEMRLISKVDQTARVLGETYAFAKGEIVVTEHCYKYDAARFDDVARAAGFRSLRRFRDERDYFSLELLAPT